MMLISSKLRIRKILRKSLKNPFEKAIVRTEFWINQFITLRLMDFGEGTEITLICVNGKRFNVFIFSLEEAYEILRDTNTYCCMDEAYRDLIVNIKGNFFNVDSDTIFWNYCDYIKAWIDHDYDTRLLLKDDAFPILKALYEARGTKAREVFKLEIIKRFLSGYFPVITYLISEGYLKYFEFGEIICLLEECIEIVGSHNYSALKTQIFWFLRDTGNNYYYNENFEKAIKYLNDALEFCPTDIETLNQLSEVYLRRDEYELARALFEIAIMLPISDGIFSKICKHKALYNLGIMYNRLHLFNKAITAYNKATDIDWDLVNTWDQIAIAYKGKGDLKRAKKAQKSFKKKENKMNKKIRFE